MTTHDHYEIQAFQEKKRYPKDHFAYHSWPKDYQMLGWTIVDVIADSEKEALKKAKSKAKRKHYRVAKVYECHQMDPEMSQELQIRNSTYMEKMVKELLKMKES